MSSRLRGFRRASQLAFLAGFLALFGCAVQAPVAPVPVDLYLRADPLLALSAMLSLRTILLPLLWYALPVALLSLLLGRVFCGWICPMGTSIDLLERVFRIRRHTGERRLALHRLKYYLLLALLVTMILPAAHRTNDQFGLGQTVGLSGVYLFDPIALLTRTLTWVGLPALQWGGMLARDTTTAWGYADIVDHHPLLARMLNPVQLGLTAVTRPVFFRLGLATFIIFAAIIALGRVQQRFWCRNLCPLGALLGFLGKISPLRLFVTEACNQCLRCVAACKVGAITDDPKCYRGPECIECCSCLAVCPQSAISITTGYEAAHREEALRLDRRRLLGALGAGVAAIVLPKSSLAVKRTDATEKVLKLSSQRLLRPPGSLPENAFVTACVRCGECMKVCPTNTLQPAVGEGGLEALGSPVIVPRAGACSMSCTRCGQVCPTRAIEPFTAKEKCYLYLGTASVNRSECIAWAFGRSCVICDEACPYDAISAEVSATGVLQPVVNEHVCVGCGMCEYVCPVEPLGAIRVGAAGDRRHLGRRRQRELREQVKQEHASDSPYPYQHE